MKKTKVAQEYGVSEPTQRIKYGKAAGYLSIGCNVLLAASKIIAGAVSGMLSVLADGMNNLTDCGSNIVSVIGFKMSGKPADKEHPFGHQRAEYVASLVIAVIILAVAAELAVQSVQKIIKPEEGVFSLFVALILAASVLIKLGMFALHRMLAKKTGSEILKATAADSLSDAVATAIVLLGLLVSRYSGVRLDGYMGLLVSLFISFAGFSVLKGTVSRLIGKAPDRNVVQCIKERVSRYEGVHGLHDLTVHNYGESKLFATVHVEVDSHTSIMAAHDLADEIERDFAQNLQIGLTVHIDPLVLDDPKINRYREQTEKAVAELDKSFRIHDFRVIGGETHANLVFDLAIPFDCKKSEKQIAAELKELMFRAEPALGLAVTVERQNTE